MYNYNEMVLPVYGMWNVAKFINYYAVFFSSRPPNHFCKDISVRNTFCNFGKTTFTAQHFLYLQHVVCSSDTDNSVKTLYFCSREVLRVCFKRTSSFEQLWQNLFIASEHNMVKQCLKNTVMVFNLRKYNF